MGCTLYASSVIGLEIDAYRLKDEIGKNKSILTEEDEDGIPVIKRLAGYKVFSDPDGSVHVVSLLKTYGSSGEHGFIKFANDFDLQKEKERMKKALKPFGLWDESKFGLYAVLECI